MKQIRKIAAIICATVILFPVMVLHSSAMTIYDGDFGIELDVSKQEAKVVDYIGTDTDISLPAYFRQFPVTTFDEYTFKGNTDLVSIKLPNTITTIPDEAFMGCTSLKAFTLPESVSSIGSAVFRCCTSLESVEFKPFLFDLPDYTFADCSSLTDVRLNFRFRNIGYGAFHNCSSLDYMDFFVNVYSVKGYSFAGTAARSIVIPETLSYLPNYSFAGNSMLTDVTIPKTVSFVEPYAFAQCDNLTVHCFFGTPGYDYAVLTGLNYVLADNVKLGDVNGDGVVNINDVTCIQRFLAELESLTGIYYHVADINQDGEVSIIDATDLQRFLAEYEVKFPVDELVTH